MSKKKRMSNRKGFTLIELMIATGLASAIVVGVGMLLVDSQRGWNRMFNRTYSDVSTDSHVARRRFDSVVRNASNQGVLLSADGSWVEVYYYSDPNSANVDRYARFYNYTDNSNGQLIIEYGAVQPRQILNNETICENVSSCVFKSAGSSIQMVLTLDDGSQSATIVASAVPHNQ
jgi:prepilin-type N-terminal cleavage/methylation domain-containing protein